MFLKILEIEGYGPFLQKTVIDFSELNFFCIQGENGSGKSTLVDAIYFALWGDSNKASSYKDLIPESVQKTRIFLQFIHNGQKIQIERIRGVKPADILKINEVDNPVSITGTKAVTQYVENNLGLKETIISKAFIISQGKFDEILKSGTRESRNAILEITTGRLFKQIQETISQKTSELTLKITEMKGALSHLSEETLKTRSEEIQISKKGLLDENQQLEDQKNHLEKNKESLQKNALKYEQFVNLQNKISQMESQLDTKKQESLELEKKIKVIDLKGDYERIQDYEKKIHEIKEKQAQNEKYSQKVKSELEQLEKQFKQILSDSIHLEKVNPIIEETKLLAFHRTEKGREYKEQQLIFNKKNDLFRDKEKSLAVFNDKIKQQELIIKELSENKKKLTFSKEKLTLLKKHLNDYFEWINLKNEETKKAQSFKDLRERIQKIKNILDEQKNKLNQLIDQENKIKETIQTSLAAKVRDTLKDGDACPVCLQTYHTIKSTHKAPNESAQPLEVNYEEIKKEIDSLKSSLFVKQGEIKTFELQEKVYSKETEDLKNQIIDKENLLKTAFSGFPLDLEKAIQEEEEKQNQALKQENLEGEIKLEIEKIKAQEYEVKKQLKEIEDELKDYQIILQKITQNGKEIASQIENNLIQLGFKQPDPKNIKDYLEELKSKLENIKNKKEEIQEAIHKKDKEKENILKDFEHSLQLLERAQNDLTREHNIFNLKLNENNLSIEDFKSDLSSDHKEKLLLKIDEIKSFFARLDNLKKDYQTQSKESEEWKIAAEEASKINKKLSEIFELIKVLTQKIGQMEKENNQIQEDLLKMEKIKKSYGDIDKELQLYRELETDFRSDNFPAAYSKMIFEQIIEEANQSFLSKVLEGRYSFLMLENKDKFEIQDSYENRCRPVDTLSGGEKFLISFALALAFSRIIGEKIGLFFIDEGFGTLDEKNRYLLQEIFNLLSQEKKRKIGLITHIPEIAEAIPQKILVQKTPKGSTVEVKFI